MSNVDTAKSDYEAFGRGDLQALNFAEDVVWITSDELPLGGETQGREAVLGNFAQLPSMWKEFAVVPERFLDAGDVVVVTGTQKATGEGGSFEAPFIHLLEYNAEGQCVRGQFQTDTAKALRALGDQAASSA